MDDVKLGPDKDKKSTWMGGAKLSTTVKVSALLRGEKFEVKKPIVMAASIMSALRACESPTTRSRASMEKANPRASST